MKTKSDYHIDLLQYFEKTDMADVELVTITSLRQLKEKSGKIWGKGYFLSLIKTDNNKYKIIELVIQDSAGSEIKAFYLLKTGMVKNIRKMLSRRHFFIGNTTNIGTTKSPELVFFINRIDNVTQRDKLGHDIKEDEIISNVLKQKVESGNGVFSYIKDVITNNLKIHELTKIKEIDILFNFIILQSILHGKESGVSLKLHSLISCQNEYLIDIFIRISKILNPTARSSKRCNIDYLIGRKSRLKGERIIKPGCLHNTSGGVVSLVGFQPHRNIKSELSSLISQSMEKGEINANPFYYEALTSLNLYISGQNSTTNTNNIPEDMLSLFDFIIELPVDIEINNRVIKVGEASGDQWKEELNRIITHIRAVYNDMKVKVNEPESEFIKEKANVMTLNQMNRQQNDKIIYGMTIRIALSIRKIAVAIACSKLKSRLTKEDIDEALEFISGKISLIPMLYEPVKLSNEDMQVYNKQYYIEKREKIHEEQVEEIRSLLSEKELNELYTMRINYRLELQDAGKSDPEKHLQSKAWLDAIDEEIKNKALQTRGTKKIKDEKLKEGTSLKKIDNFKKLTTAYLNVIQDTQHDTPSIEALHEYSGLTKTEINRLRDDILFLGFLQKELVKKINYAKKKETREVWIHAEKVISDSMYRISNIRAKDREKSMTDARRAIIERRESEDDDIFL